MKKLITFLLSFFMFLTSCNRQVNIEILFNSIFELVVGNSKDDIVGYATCFKAKDLGIVTNCHNILYVDANGNFKTYNYIAGKVYNSNIIIEFVTSKYSYEDDFAILIPNDNDKELYDEIDALNYNNSNNFNISDKCYCIGNLNNYGLSYNEGSISIKLKKLEYHNKENYFIQTNLEISKGVSGSPLFDANNDVIGVVTFKLRDSSLEYIDGLSFAIPISEIFKNLSDL